MSTKRDPNMPADCTRNNFAGWMLGEAHGTQVNLYIVAPKQVRIVVIGEFGRVLWAATETLPSSAFQLVRRIDLGYAIDRQYEFRAETAAA